MEVAQASQECWNEAAHIIDAGLDQVSGIADEESIIGPS